MFEHWFWVTVPLAAFAAIGLLIYKMGRYPKKQEPGKEDTYTGGEEIADLAVRPDNFYQAIKRTLRLTRLQHMHTGDVSDYLIWLLVGLVAIILMVSA
jgi:hypothetical protein